MAVIDALDEQSSLREYAKILWGRRWIIIVVVLATVGLSLAYSAATTRVYEGTADLLLSPPLPATILQANNAAQPNAIVDVPTQIQVIESASVADIVRKTIPDAPAVTAAQVGATTVVTVSVESPDPQLAARSATAYANAYLRLQRQQTAATLTAASALLQQHLNALQATITQVHDEVAAVGTSNAGVQAELSSLQAALQTEAEGIQSQLTTYGFFAQTQAGESGQVVTAASVPTKPVKPKTGEYALLAAILGLALGIGVALIVETFDDGIREREDLERASDHQTILGLVPEIPDWRYPEAAYLVSRSAPRSSPAEAYRSLRTAIQFLGLERSIRTLQFTSPSGPEGKTTTLANLAVVIAQAGLRVVIVDCDLRRPRLHDFFGLSNRIGFTSVLLQERTLEEALEPVPGLENLRILASGPIPPNPSELISGAHAAELLQALGEDADLVLIDSPPVLPLSDAVALAGQVDAVALVAAAGVSTRSQVSRSLQRLAQVDAPVLGIVLNHASAAESTVKTPSGSGGRRDRAGRGRGGRKAAREASGAAGDTGSTPATAGVATATVEGDDEAPGRYFT
jgi:capsular exopolysaccharide synthesis family protein